MKRLNIVIPYRAREAHLKRLQQGLGLYFARDKIDRDIPHRVLVIEQENGQLFNSGMLKNIGFLLGRDQSDYTSFHDVDYIPIWADYSWPDKPVGIVWYGAEFRPVRLSDPLTVIRHGYENFFGGVVLTSNSDFEQVNGFSNSYWGWGWEDADLRKRFELAKIGMGRRKGTFQALDHDHNGYDLNGSLSPAAQINKQLFDSRWPDGPLPEDRRLPEDGLSTLAFEVLNRHEIPNPNQTAERLASWEMITVRLSNAQAMTGSI